MSPLAPRSSLRVYELDPFPVSWFYSNPNRLRHVAGISGVCHSVIRHGGRNEFASKREACECLPQVTAPSRWCLVVTLHVVDHLLVGSFRRQLPLASRQSLTALSELARDTSSQIAVQVVEKVLLPLFVLLRRHLPLPHFRLICPCVRLLGPFGSGALF